MRDDRDKLVDGPNTEINIIARSTSFDWRIRIFAPSGYGAYRLLVQMYQPSTSGGGGGGCGCHKMSPYVFSYNGIWNINNNVLPQSGKIVGDVLDRYMLQQGPTVNGGYYFLKIRELGTDHDYFDHVAVTVVDHAASVKVGVDPNGRILTYRAPSPPISVQSSLGTSPLSQVSSPDGVFYQASQEESLTVRFGRQDTAEGARLILHAESFDNTPIKVETRDGRGPWTYVADVYARGFPSTVIIDLSRVFPQRSSEPQIRLSFQSQQLIDYVAIDTTKQEQVSVLQLQLAFAFHSKLGEVTRQVEASDDYHAELLPDQEMFFVFQAFPQTTEARDFILSTEGHYLPL